ncbi:hypothetical protein N9C66_11015, partial [Akkermansiaceae bacterium]|nr:hypothetical protein [Akkermansiaceae bacterium]
MTKEKRRTESAQKTADDVREEWIGSAEEILRAGKGHMGIITFLRSKGLRPDEAKKVSYDIFDEAKRRLLRSQLAYRAVAWSLILVGLLLPVALFFLMSGGLVFIAGTPLI